MSEPTQFDYLLNTLEHASQADDPAKAGYGEARKALFAYVRSLEKSWLPISEAPKDDTIVDLWVVDIWDAGYGYRLANYRRVELEPDNVFYDPVADGECTVRTASYFMLPPAPPKGMKE